MFTKAIKMIEDCLFGIANKTVIGNTEHRTLGTGFAINDNVILTCAHLCHINNDVSKPLQQIFQVIKDSNLGIQMQIAKLIAIDEAKDLAAIQCPNITSSVTFNKNLPDEGTQVGSLGYPNNSFDAQSRKCIFIKRFKGSFISTFNNQNTVVFTDQEMYPGTSGCPVFNKEGLVIGVHNRNEYDPKNDVNRIDIAYNVSIKEIESFLNTNGISYTSV